jgi:hypothetical protein
MESNAASIPPIYIVVVVILQAAAMELTVELQLSFVPPLLFIKGIFLTIILVPFLVLAFSRIYCPELH